LYVITVEETLTFDYRLYVEKLTPSGGVQHPHPLVFFHGGAVSGVTWLNTPDGRRGFASYFLEQGYQVYLLVSKARPHPVFMDQLCYERTPGICLNLNITVTSMEYIAHRY
jgi:hypothetical protein